MPENKKAVFVILAEMRRRVLGISDQNQQGMDSVAQGSHSAALKGHNRWWRLKSQQK
jgi:hypothetical protein